MVDDQIDLATENEISDGREGGLSLARELSLLSGRLNRNFNLPFNSLSCNRRGAPGNTLFVTSQAVVGTPVVAILLCIADALLTEALLVLIRDLTAEASEG